METEKDEGEKLHEGVWKLELVLSYPNYELARWGSAVACSGGAPDLSCLCKYCKCTSTQQTEFTPKVPRLLLDLFHSFRVILLRLPSTMSTEGKVKCPACQSMVARSFLTLHLQRSTNPRCRAWYTQYQLQLTDEMENDTPLGPGPSSSRPGPISSEPSTPSTSELAIDHRGDYFGDYETYADEEMDYSYSAEGQDIMMEEENQGW